MDRLVDRPRIIENLLADETPVTVLNAPAGMGKSCILQLLARHFATDVTFSTAAPEPTGASAPVLWDIPPYGTPAPIPDGFLAGQGRLIIAKRPDVVLPGLSRALAYRHARVIDTEALLMSPDELRPLFGDPRAEAILADTAGWPLAVFNDNLFSPDDATMSTFLQSEMLETMPEADLVDLRILLDGGTARAFEDHGLLPFARPDGNGALRFGMPSITQALDEALHLSIAARIKTAAGAKAIAEAFAERGRTVDAIETFQNAGFFDNALRLFEKAGGNFFIYFHGPKAFENVLAGFPRTYAMQSEELVLSHALQALKQGDVSRARRLLADRYGDSANDLGMIFSARSVFSREFRAFRLLMLLYEDYFFSEELLDRAYALMAEFPIDDHLFRGSFYNSVLEFYIRNRRFAEAEDVAQRAMYHYRQAGSPMLAFYISLHQALIRLLMGDALTARKHAALSSASLNAMGFESPNDRRLQVLLDACVEYEGGKAEPLARFLSLEIDDFSHGEIWPSLLEFALHYGSQALGEHFSTIAARSFLDRWRVYQASNGQFQTMISIREAAVLQNANRWQEAAEHLTALKSRVDRSFVLAGGDELVRLHERDELALALIWLRQIVYEMPGREDLDGLITTMIGNLHMTDRQRMAAEIWLAHVSKRQRNLTKARAVLQKTFGDCARLGTIAPLAEERVFLQELIDNQRIGGFLATSSPIRQIIRKLRDAGRLASDTGNRSELSRRESKILLMISEGAANKFVANTLGLSEATVKFHLGNVYRKLGCRNRQEAISSARALGLVS
ncbi:regulator [Pararhizobium polonicum]|uniref:Regulator n=1 Tax=Pararhizobium polonicum TaxID=1612624 RepID=A0A1C7P0P2_9HYPH|nr:LuxR C-terminal-related transcriptional regulator [Pararhizobium polonicum]OBZ94842.1 regulator [Pararhizobium polonicum]